MKVFVMVDMEGISGICKAVQVTGEGTDYYLAGRRYLGQDGEMPCVEGARSGGGRRGLWCGIRDGGGLILFLISWIRGRNIFRGRAGGSGCRGLGSLMG